VNIRSMGMAPYGKPKHLNKIQKLVRIYKDGSFSLNMDYFAFQRSADQSYSRKFIELFGEPRPKDLHFFTRSSGYPSYFGENPPIMASLPSSIRNMQILLLQFRHFAKK